MSDIYNEQIPGPRGSGLKSEHLEYTKADLDVAREQAAAEMRGKSVEAISRLMYKYQDHWPAKMLEALDHAMSEIELLGPLADLAARVRRETVEKCAKAFDKHFAVYLSVHGMSFDDLKSDLAVIAAGTDAQERGGEEGKK